MTEREPIEPCCADCKFRRFATNECHRHAPLVTGGMMSEIKTVWPIIADDNWCGDFELFPYADGEPEKGVRFLTGAFSDHMDSNNGELQDRKP